MMMSDDPSASSTRGRTSSMRRLRIASPPPSPPWLSRYDTNYSAELGTPGKGQYQVLPHLADNRVDVPRASLELILHGSRCEIAARSRLMRPDCHDSRSYNHTGIPLLITATGRSGTKFLQTLLSAVGLQVQHDNTANAVRLNGSKEKMWPAAVDVVVAWPQAFEDTARCQVPTFGVKADPRRFLHLAHLIRHPLQSIQSRWNMGSTSVFEEVSKCFTAAGMGTSRMLSKLDASLQQTLRHYVLWNSFVEATARFHLPLEDVDVFSLRSLLAFGGLTLHATDAVVNETLAAFKNKSELINSAHTRKEPVPLSWRRLAAIDAEFTTLAQLTALRHGYSIDRSDLTFDPRRQRAPQQHCGWRLSRSNRTLFISQSISSLWACWIEHTQR
jgi:hypothetical protein